MYIKGLELSEADRGELGRIVKKGRDWRMRERAQTLLYFDAGWEAKAIAAQQELHLDTVYDRRKHWLAEGFASLVTFHYAKAAVQEYIEIFYNRQRRHSRLGYLSPAVFAETFKHLQAA